jgi:hypothetical protein
MAEHIVTQVTVPPILVPFGEGTVTVPTWPIPLKPVEKRGDDLVDDQDGLVLGPKGRHPWKSWFLGSLAIVPSLVVLLVTVSSAIRQLPVVLGVLIAGFALLFFGFLWLIFLSVLSSGTWVRFDRKNRQIRFSRRPTGFRRAPRVFRIVNLDDVACLQLIYNGYHVEDWEVGDQEQKSIVTSRFHAYQMNLVLGTGTSERINLANHSDWQWIRESGGRIAASLQIPVVDQLHHGG